MDRYSSTRLIIPKKNNIANRPANSMKLTFIIGGIVLLILTLGFNAMFNLAFLDKLCVESVVSQYKIIGKDLQRTIQKSICLGKNIKKFIKNLSELLQKEDDEVF